MYIWPFILCHIYFIVESYYW